MLPYESIHQPHAILPSCLLQDVFRPPQQPITRRRSGGDARTMKTRRAENNRRAQQRWRDRQKVKCTSRKPCSEHVKTRCAENNRRVQQQWRDRQQVNHLSL